MKIRFGSGSGDHTADVGSMIAGGLPSDDINNEMNS